MMTTTISPPSCDLKQQVLHRYYVNVCLSDTSIYVGIASFPGTLAPECEHGNHAGKDSLVSFLTRHQG